MGEFKQQLGNGNEVTLATWQGHQPTRHGQDMHEKPWSASDTRASLSFYESTIQYMRNDWAGNHMPAFRADVGGQHVLLFHGALTDTWHTVDALDIDHVKPWKQHLQALDVDNMADANIAYNDISNLRMLPSIHNRGRDGGDRILEAHGPDSNQWKSWVDSRFSFDNSIQYREFDPETDNARRTKVTLGKSWTEENTRSELSFDKRVMEVWFDSELKKNFAGSVPIQSTDGKQQWNVPLFKCAATGQLVTRDALDIDHAIPFEQLLKKMHELHPGGFSKADALDAYNDTSNLRLVGRSANSSHEWELMPDGQFRDKVEPEIPNEFKRFIVEQDRTLDSGERRELGEAIGQMREGFRLNAERYWAQQNMPQGILQPGVLPQGTPQTVVPQTGGHGPQPGTSPPLLNQQGHPDNGLFQRVVGQIADLDPKQQVFNPQQRESMASSLMVVARHEGLPGIDHVVWNTSGTALVAVSGTLDSPASRISWMEPQQGMHRTIEQNTEALQQIATRQQSQTPTTQSPSPQHIGF